MFVFALKIKNSEHGFLFFKSNKPMITFTASLISWQILYYIDIILFFLQNPYGARDLEDGPPRQRKGSILRAASALAQGIDEQEDVTYVPRKAWVKQPTTGDLLQEKQDRRDQFTWEVDFNDFEMPFKKNISTRCKLMAEEDD